MAKAVDKDSAYQEFLKTSIKPNLVSAISSGPFASEPKSLSDKQVAATGIDNWQDVPEGNIGKIINEIAKKFNRNARLGIKEAVYNPKGEASQYSVDNRPATQGYGPSQREYGHQNLGKPSMTLVAKNKTNSTTRKQGPDPVTVGHELVHANDHQIDQFTPEIWGYMQNLANTGGTNQGKQNWQQFKDSMRTIQNKINPEGTFSNSYMPYLDRDLTGIGMRTGQLGDRQDAAYQDNVIPEWDNIFNYINESMNKRYPAENEEEATEFAEIPENLKNRYFTFNHASEYPAFLSERLTDRLKTGENTATDSGNKIRALSNPEAEFIYKVLGNMDRAYPGSGSKQSSDTIMKEKAKEKDNNDVAMLDVEGYPVMSNYIRERRKSIGGYYPDALWLDQMDRPSNNNSSSNIMRSAANDPSGTSNTNQSNMLSASSGSNELGSSGAYGGHHAPGISGVTFPSSNPYSKGEESGKRRGGYISRVLMGERKARGGPVGMSRYLNRITGVY